MSIVFQSHGSHLGHGSSDAVLNRVSIGPAHPAVLSVTRHNLADDLDNRNLYYITGRFGRTKFDKGLFIPEHVDGTIREDTPPIHEQAAFAQWFGEYIQLHLPENKVDQIQAVTVLDEEGGPGLEEIETRSGHRIDVEFNNTPGWQAEFQKAFDAGDFLSRLGRAVDIESQKWHPAMLMAEHRLYMNQLEAKTD